jgi:hypothetical protein
VYNDTQVIKHHNRHRRLSGPSGSMKRLPSGEEINEKPAQKVMTLQDESKKEIIPSFYSKQ